LQIACLDRFVTQRIDFVGLFSFSGELPADRAILGTLIAVLQANFQRNVEKQAIGQNTRRACRSSLSRYTAQPLSSHFY